MAPSSVELAPLRVVFHYTRHSVPLVGLKLLLSALFPLAVAAAFGRTALRDPMLRLAWLGFAAGAFYAYGLAESGRRLVDGNFLWSGQVSLLVLFVASARWLVAHLSSARGRVSLRVVVCGTVLSLHVLAGCLNAARFVATGDRYFVARSPVERYHLGPVGEQP
jgi:hypothetical protein